MTKSLVAPKANEVWLEMDPAFNGPLPPLSLSLRTVTDDQSQCGNDEIYV